MLIINIDQSGHDFENLSFAGAADVARVSVYITFL